MAGITAEAAPGPAKPTSLFTVVAASAAGTSFEWYDFFIFGSLAQTIGAKFFSQLGATAGLVAALALFGVGFAFRPLGALIFGRVGDRLGRKAAFFICVSLMGLGTFCIGLLPTSQQIGVAAPIALIALRILQGTALGGQYGGAAVYVAEHAPAEKRGFLTGWVQTSAALGLIAALTVIYVTRQALGEAAFTSFGWRIPFFASAGLVAISIWMRLRLSESPAFQRLKEVGGATKAPFAEAFGTWANLKVVLITLVALMCAQGAYWYTVFFYSQVFMEKFLKVDSGFANLLIMGIAWLSAPLYVFFAWLSDKVGRKWVMWSGMALGLVTLFPGFTVLSSAANPALAAAARSAQVVVVADPADCSLQFDPVGKSQFLSSCDIAKATLANAGIGYRNEAAPAGTTAAIRIGAVAVPSVNARALPQADRKAAVAQVGAAIHAALAKAGYPTAADPAQRNGWLMFAVLAVFTVAATALYGPMAASLTELFPTRIRYTAMSVPYHLGIGWIGGFQPVASFSIVVATGNVLAGLWYPAIFTAISVVAALFLLPETRGRSLEE